MPVSHAHRFIFIHIPKTAGTSILRAFVQSGVPLDYSALGLWDLFLHHPDGAEILDRYRRTFRASTIANAPQQHLPAPVVRKLIPDVWDSYFKFAFVRNPWDLLVSTYHFQIGRLDAVRALSPDVHAVLDKCASFEDFVRWFPVMRGDMTSFLADEHGRFIVDFVGRYESIERDFAYVCERLGIEAPLGHENRSEHASYREYYTPETRAIVERHFARDIERFGYAF